jgi:hypothetical protein
MSQKIIFTKVKDVSNAYFPKPASDYLPDWYKKTPSYLGGKKELDANYTAPSTIKKCQPVFDVLTAGYIIPTYCDLWIRKDEEGNIIYVTSALVNIEQHPVSQAIYHPYMNNNPFPKWVNPWSISTPKGYSCLFIPPVHGGNDFFTIVDGLVDTDHYNNPVNFPFVLKDKDFEGLIPAGTPMVQVIPIKRDIWKMEEGPDKMADKIHEDAKKLESVFFNRYKSLFWQRKEYK